jgi:putative membrane protein
LAEWIGVHEGWLFGNYWYGETLGPKWQGIPFLIAVNWVVVITGAASLTEQITKAKWLFPAITATIATVYDFTLEPIAMQLGYWMWQGRQVPGYNYLCWWLLTLVLACFWQHLRLKGNLFAASLFIVQLIFFLILRIVL